jgi:DivIVA domain-containing protein
MSASESAAAFPVVTGRAKGYEPAAVDAFLERARQAYEGEDDGVTAADVRSAAFALRRGGYDIAAVDAALTRLEDAFALRERQRALALEGAREWVGESRARAQEILDRLRRPRGHRFRRVGPLRFGYRVAEVDIVADRLARYLETGEGVSVAQVRSVAFRMQLRGYDEAQVDALLDGVVDVMLAVG